LPVKVSNATQNGTSVTIAAGIEWAATNGAKVINVSSATGPSLALKDATQVASANDAVLVAGAGNKPDFLQFGYPAAMEGVLAVGSTDRTGKHAGFSITGQQIDLCAPGVDIGSTRPKGKYSVSRGTSSSTAIVSGAAALVRSKFPNLSAQEVIQRLTSTATDIGPPGRDDQCGYGLLNIVAALTAPAPSSAAPTPDTPAPTTTEAPPPTPTPEREPASDNTPLIAGGIVAALAAAGALAFVVTRRRRNP
jgi:subtilisin family serine protease